MSEVKTVTCLLCFRSVLVDRNGKMVPHDHTPMLSEARCEGSGRTPGESKAFGQQAIREYRERNKKK